MREHVLTWDFSQVAVVPQENTSHGGISRCVHDAPFLPQTRNAMSRNGAMLPFGFLFLGRLSDLGGHISTHLLLFSNF